MTVQNFQQIIVRSKLLNLLLLEFIFLQYLHYLALSLICFLLRKILKIFYDVYIFVTIP